MTKQFYKLFIWRIFLMLKPREKKVSNSNKDSLLLLYLAEKADSPPDPQCVGKSRLLVWSVKPEECVVFIAECRISETVSAMYGLSLPHTSYCSQFRWLFIPCCEQRYVRWKNLFFGFGPHDPFQMKMQGPHRRLRVGVGFQGWGRGLVLGLRLAFRVRC